MGTAKFAQLKSIFTRALELREGEAVSYLDSACGDNLQLRAQVEEMLRQAVCADTALLTEVPVEITHALAIGSVLANRFVLKSFIGRGGMGEVYLAEDQELGGQVALKTVRGGLLDSQGTARFRREVQLSRQVTHRNICRVFDVGKEVVDGRELIFLTMEYLEGETLSRRLARTGKIDLEEGERLIRQMALALDALHEKGIMHRDLKPANVMLEGDRLCIMDFGLARAFEGEGSDAHYTQTGAILGTPGYMAPEQLVGEQATQASDIYSMGLLIFEMLTGKKASTSETLAEGKTRLPPNWEALVLRCTARNAANRPKSGGEALAMLDQRAAPGTAPAKFNWKWIAVAIALAIGLASISYWRKSGAGTILTNSGTSANDQILRARQLLVRYYKPQNVKDALSILEGVVRQDPNLALGHASLAAALLRTGTDQANPSLLERARQECNKAIELDPEMAEPHVTLGSIYLDSGRRDLARSEFRKALEMDSRLPEVHFGLAQLYRAEGRMPEKEAAIQKAIDLAPDNWAYRNWRSSEYRDQGKLEEARAEIEIALKLMPDSPLIYNNLGVIYLRMRRFEDAQNAFQKSNEIEPRARTLGNLGATYYLQAKYDEAAATLQKVVEMDPKSYLMRANLAAALDRIPEKKTDALDNYRKSIELAAPLLAATPNDHRLLANVASYHAVVGNRDQALSLIRKAIALRPDSPDVANRAVAVYEFLKDREGALKWAANAVKNGYPLETLKSDPELAGLRADPRFNKIESSEKERKDANPSNR